MDLAELEAEPDLAPDETPAQAQLPASSSSGGAQTQPLPSPAVASSFTAAELPGAASHSEAAPSQRAGSAASHDGHETEGVLHTAPPEVPEPAAAGAHARPQVPNLALRSRLFSVSDDVPVRLYGHATGPYGQPASPTNPFESAELLGSGSMPSSPSFGQRSGSEQEPTLMDSAGLFLSSGEGFERHGRMDAAGAGPSSSGSIFARGRFCRAAMLQSCCRRTARGRAYIGRLLQGRCWDTSDIEPLVAETSVEQLPLDMADGALANHAAAQPAAAAQLEEARSGSGAGSNAQQRGMEPSMLTWAHVNSSANCPQGRQRGRWRMPLLRSGAGAGAAAPGMRQASWGKQHAA